MLDRPRLNRTKPRPKLKLRKRASTPFNEAVEQGADVTRRLDRLVQADSQRFSAKALFKETLAIIGSTAERIARLRRKIESSDPAFAHSRPTHRRIQTFLLSGNWIGPLRNPARLGHLGTPATDAELARIGYSLPELYLVSVQTLAESHPEAFGKVESSEKLSQEVTQLRERQKQLYEKIQTTFTPADLEERNGHVTFKLSDGNVALTPTDNAAERLVNYLISKR
jgi:hypothetical protein